jgi:hypothetical protein
MSIKDDWYERAKQQTLETLPAFLKELADYPTNYITSVHAIGAAAVAASWAMNNDGCSGGITNNQAGCVMWEYIRQWMGYTGPMQLVSYKEMLYPQYDYRYNKTMPEDTWIWLKQEARKNIEDWIAGKRDPSPIVTNHWLRIVSGEMPYGYILEKDYEQLPMGIPIHTQADVLKAYKLGLLVYRRR